MRVADGQARADAERPVVIGRFLGDGDARVEASRRGAEVALRVRDPGKALREITVDLGAPIARVSGVEPGGPGRLFLSAVTRPTPAGPMDPAPNAHVVLLIDLRDGRVIARHEVPAADVAEETFRSVRLGADGALYVLRSTRSGAEIWKVSP